MAAILAAVVAADQLTKLVVVRALDIGQSRTVIGGLLWISHVRNTGAAFSMFPGAGTLFALAAIAGIVVLAVVIARRPTRLVGYAAALVAGGAFGNLIDRMTRGSVVDFVDFRGRWPAFNVADSAIVVGVLLLLLFSARAPRSERDGEPADDPG